MKRKKLCALFLSSLFCLTLLNGCASEKNTSEEVQEQQTTSQDNDKVSNEDSTENQESETSDDTDGNVGEFSMQDIQGETYTQDMFADYDLTMVNVFTTWCTPCVNEIPDLQKLWEEKKEQGINVVGIVLDSIDAYGTVDQETVEKAKLLSERTGAVYPFLIPDSSYMNGRLAGIEAVPETFFVDKNGDIVDETYSGSRSFEDWQSIVETIHQEIAP